jgi:uncharacterized metal-binding protein
MDQKSKVKQSFLGIQKVCYGGIKMADKNTCCGGVRLVFPCSGAADVGGIADQVGRKITMEGLGRMYCLAGIGGHVEGILETTKQAEAIFTIDGCPVACATKALEHVGFRPRAINLRELGFAKGESPANEANINSAFMKIKAVME